MQTIYLAGAIQGAPDQSWRDRAAEIAPNGWRVEDPRHFNISKLLPSEIVRLDFSIVLGCDFVLVKVDQPSWGTAMEIMIASQHGIPVIAFPDIVPRSPWLDAHVNHFYATLEDAMQSMENNLL